MHTFTPNWWLNQVLPVETSVAAVTPVFASDFSGRRGYFPALLSL